MHPFLVKYRVGNKTEEEEMLASSAEEAKSWAHGTGTSVENAPTRLLLAGVTT